MVYKKTLHMILLPAIIVMMIVGTFPVLAAEVGPNDFRISDMGPNNTAGYEAFQSKVAYNSTTKQYLVVWRGDEQADLQAEIYGQLIDAATGAEVGSNDFLIARIGAAGDLATDAIEPAVAYNSVRNEFLVVFAGDVAPDPPPLIVDTFEIYAQRVGANGSLIGGQLRLSDMGLDDTNGSYDASKPAIAYNPGSDQYLVVWEGDDNTPPLINNEQEIFAQLIGYSGSNLVEIGTNDFQVSTMGPDGVGTHDARNPSVAYNSAASEYLVTWEGNDAAPQPTGAFQIFGQRLSSAGAPVGTDDFLIGSSGDEAYSPDISYNSTDNQYLVVWEGDNGAANDFEVYGQLLNGTGSEIGADFQISDAGTSSTHLAQTPAVAYNNGVNEYLVIWKGEDDFGGLIDGEFEVFGKRLTATGALIEGTSRLSNMGPNGTANSSTQTPDVAYSDVSRNAYLAVWAAENQPTTAPNEIEIWGQLVGLRSDLQITKSVSPNNPPSGGTVTYTITYVNAGPDPALNVVITDLVPAGVTSPSFSTSSVTGSPPVLRSGTTFIWDVARLNSGQGGTITITGQVGALATNTVVGNTASIATSTIIVDSNTANNSQTVNFTVSAPLTVTLSSATANPTNANPIPVTAQFSASVTGFTASDIVAGNATITNFVAVDGDTYTFGLIPTANGLVTADVPAGVAQNSGGTGNQAATQLSRTYDGTAPSVTINQAAGQADPTGNSPINFTIVFSEPVSGFATGDVTLSGTAGATTALVSGSGTTYNVALSGMTSGGTVIASIASSVASDAAGNGNSSSTSTDSTVTFVVDSTPPDVTLSSPTSNPTNASPIPVTAQFSENVTGFTASDIVAGNATVANFVAVDGDTYTFDLVASASGLVTADIPAGVATDATGNPNQAAAQFSRTFDNVAPTVTINQASGQADPTSNSTINFEVVFSEPVSGFDGTDVALTGTAGATTVDVTGGPAAFNIAVSGMTSSGTVIANIAAAAATDTAGNGNSISTSTDNEVTFQADTTAPGVAMSSVAPDPTNTSPIPVTAQFTESVTDFAATDIVAGNGTVSNFVAVDGDTYTFDLIPSGQGAVTADIPAGVAQDSGGNPSTAAAQFSRTFDSIAPAVTVNQASGQADPTGNSPIVFEVVFSEAVTGFNDTADVDLSASTAPGSLSVTITQIDAQNYTVSVNGMSGSGTVVASIPANSAADATGNGNTASTSDDNTVTFVAATPDLTISKAHTGNFTQGQTGAQYTITVSNGGSAPSSGMVTVVDALPSGLTATAIGGTGWDCTLASLTCTRNDALAASSSYPAITLTVDVANNAPASVTNSASVSGGGEQNTSNNTANDPTTIDPPANQNPTAVITGESSVTLACGAQTATIVLSGTNSSDPDGDSLTYQWFINDVPAGTGSSISPSLGAGTYTVKLTVNDGKGGSNTNTFQVTVNPATNCPPPAPMCNSQTATIYVNAQGKIVGGPDNGKTYKGDLHGTNGPDVIVGTNRSEDIDGKGGHDIICGGSGNDEIEGGSGNDQIFGEAGKDEMLGEEGNDILTGGTGADKFNGGPGRDTATDYKRSEKDTKSSIEQS